MSEETQYLSGIPGANVETKLLGNGAYNLRVVYPSVSGKQITLYIVCQVGYPQKAPSVIVEVDGQEIAFQSSILQRWNGQYLVEIAREAKNRVG
jgi:hypothetical protein